jgi:hypothetical protein
MWFIVGLILLASFTYWLRRRYNREHQVYHLRAAIARRVTERQQSIDGVRLLLDSVAEDVRSTIQNLSEKNIIYQRRKVSNRRIGPCVIL